MNRLWYKLDGHEVMPATVQEAEASLNDVAARTVGDTTIEGVRVSTVFLGLDHNHSGEGPPVLFETMVFAEGNRELDGLQRRCCTWAHAEAQHAIMVNYVRQMKEAGLA